MLIKSLKLKNIRSYLSQEIKFDKGITLLSGDIGAGKTTILLSLEFALFGTSKTELPGTSLLRHGKSKGSVELSFEINNKEILINRTIERTAKSVAQTSGYIIIDEHKKEMTSEELKATIFKLLGYPKQLIKKEKNFLYRFTVYTPQEEMKNIIYENNEVRMNTLRRIFQIDRYKTIRENSLILMRNLRQKKKYLKQEISEFKFLEEEIKSLENEKASLTIQIAEKQKAISKIKIEKDELKIKLEKHEKQISNLKETRNKIFQEIHFLQQQKERIKKQFHDNVQEEKAIHDEFSKIKILNITSNENQLKNEINETNSKITMLEKNESKLTEQLRNYDERQNSISEEIKELEKKTSQIKLIKNRISENEKTLSNLKGLGLKLEIAKKTHESLITKEKEFQTTLRQLKDDSTKLNNEICPLCKQKMSKEHRDRILKENQKSILKIEEQIKRTKEMKDSNLRNLKTMEKDLENLNDLEKLITEDKSKLHLLNELQNNLKKKIKELEEINNHITLAKKQKEKIMEKPKLKSKLDELNQKLSEILLNHEKLKQKDLLKKRFNQLKKVTLSLKEEHKSLEEQIAKLTKSLIPLKEIEEKEKAIKQLKAQFQNVDNNERNLSEQNIALKTSLMNYNSNLSKLKEKLKLRNQKKSELNLSLNLMEWFEKYFIPLTEDIEKTVMLTVYSEFNDFFVQWFQMLINDENLQTKLDESFSPIILQNGYETTITNLSGGEKTSLALAYRLALNKVINNLMTKIQTSDLIILDEPTDGFSSEQLDNVREVLTELDTNQIIIVSHESKIESFAENIIYIKKHAGSSTF